MKILLDMVESIKNDKKEFVIKIVTTSIDGITKISAILIPVAAYLICFDRGMHFETEGVYKSFGMQNLMRNIKPGK